MKMFKILGIVMAVGLIPAITLAQKPLPVTLVSSPDKHQVDVLIGGKLFTLSCIPIRWKSRYCSPYMRLTAP